MLRRILVATDLSESSSYVFEDALLLAKAVGATLGLLHVTDLAETDDELPRYPAGVEAYFDGDGILEPACYLAHNLIEPELFGDSVTKAAAAGVHIDCIHCFGDPERAICDFAEAWHADLIVLGRRGRSSLVEFFLGSVSNYTLHHAPCSVYVAHRPAAIDPETATPASLSSSF